MEVKRNENDIYYIMDLCQNYYRLDSEGQLIVATGKDQASIFSMQEVYNKLGKGKKASFYKVISVNGNKMLTAEMITDLASKEAGEYQKSDTMENSYDISKIDWCEYLRAFCYLNSTTSNYFAELQKQQSDADLEICDLLHYIELYDVKNEEEKELVEALKDARLRRRNIMDTIEAVKMFQESIGTSGNLAKAQKALNHLEALDKRKYVPRILPELFKGCTPSKHKLNQQSAEDVQNEIQQIDNKENRRVVHMSEIRRDTVYDSKKVDWIQFAKDQVEFYKNAEQHINNLRIDINNIDDEIEHILHQIESGNFSAVQGYKVFKRLRDLRNRRKEKLMEYDAVSILIEPFNCDSMHEQFEFSLSEIQKLEEEPVKDVSEEVC